MFGRMLSIGLFHIGPTMRQTTAALEMHGQRPSSPQRNVGALGVSEDTSGDPHFAWYISLAWLPCESTSCPGVEHTQ